MPQPRCPQCPTTSHPFPNWQSAKPQPRGHLCCVPIGVTLHPWSPGEVVTPQIFPGWKRIISFIGDSNSNRRECVMLFCLVQCKAAPFPTLLCFILFFLNAKWLQIIFSYLLSFHFLEPKTFDRCKLLHLNTCGSELSSPSSDTVGQMNPHYSRVLTGNCLSFMKIYYRYKWHLKMAKQEFRYFTFLSQSQTMRTWWFFFCCGSKATGSFLIPTLYNKDIKSGRERQSFEGPALHLAVEGMSTKWVGWTGLAKADSMVIPPCSHRLSGSLMSKPTSYFTAVVCIVEASLNMSKTWRTKQPQQRLEQ